MNDATPTPESGCRLSDAELLQWHQLNIAHFWQERGDDRKGAAAAPQRDQTVALPEKWNLLGDLTLSDWQRQCLAKWLAADRRGVVKTEMLVLEIGPMTL